MVNASTNPCAGCHERDREIADLQALEKRLKEVEADLVYGQNELAKLLLSQGLCLATLRL